VELTVDGRPVTARVGQTVLQACIDAGIHVPRLCHDPRLEPYGACRLCVVEIEGMRGFPTSCTTLATEGLIVTTDSDALRSMRTTVVELLLSDHNISCLTCESNGHCGLQNLAYEFKIDTPRFSGAVHTGGVSDDNPLITRDLTKCIACGRCVRICAEVQGANVYGYHRRGFDVLPDTPYSVSLTDAGCEFCGQCVSTCPVGALTDRRAHFAGRPWETTSVETICGYCGVGCTVSYQVKNGRIVNATAPLDRGVNRGNLCAKGRYGWSFTHSPERLTAPLIRRDGVLTPATWDEAIAVVAERLNSIVTEHGPDSVGGLASAKATNEENYLFQKFLRAVIGTHNIDHCARL
jgi:NADH dehydrogenase/NADH:ubiquinone oxidoreductase subunit G